MRIISTQYNDGPQQAQILQEQPISRAIGNGPDISPVSGPSDFSFEADMIHQFNCEIHVFDCDVDGSIDMKSSIAALPTNVTFHPWCITHTDGVNPNIPSNVTEHSGHSNQYHTLVTIQQKLGHTTRIPFANIAIDQNRFHFIRSWHSSTAPIQLVLQTSLHNIRGGLRGAVSEREWTSWWSLRSLRYNVFSFKPKIGCLCCCEFSLRWSAVPKHHNSTLVTAY